NGRIDYEIYSQQANVEIVHCQGHAVPNHQPAPGRVGLEQLERQRQLGSHRLVPLRLPEAVEDTTADYVLHPSVIDSALQACVALIDGASARPSHLRLPIALDTLRIVSPCTPEMIAWVQHAPAHQAEDQVIKLDVDLCDERGNVAVQMRGLSWQAAVVDRTSSEPARKEVVVVAPAPSPLPPVAQKKPTGISLAAPGTVVGAAAVSSERTGPKPSAGQARIALSQATGPLPRSESGPAASPVRLFDDGNGVFSIQVAAPEDHGTCATDVVTHLLRALEHARQEAAVKVLRLSG